MKNFYERNCYGKAFLLGGQILKVYPISIRQQSSGHILSLILQRDIHLGISRYTQVYIQIYTQVYTQMYTQVYTQVYTQIYTCVYLDIPRCISRYTQVYIQVYIYTHIGISGVYLDVYIYTHRYIRCILGCIYTQVYQVDIIQLQVSQLGLRFLSN